MNGLSLNRSATTHKTGRLGRVVLWSLIGCAALASLGGALYATGHQRAASASFVAAAVCGVPAGIVVAGIAACMVLAIAVILVALPLSPFFMLWSAWQQRRTLRAIDELDRRFGAEEEFRPLFAKLNVVNAPEADRRLSEAGRPSRKFWIPFASADCLRSIAVDSTDPVAPWAWLQALSLQHVQVLDDVG